MRDILNKIAKSTIILIIGIIIGCSLGVYAVIKYSATDIGYKNKTVKEALDELYKGKESKICKRATKLHSDGAHTYGSLGTKGTLASGDAFDCDVDGDEYYDREEERFYYVSPLYLGGDPTQESSWDKSIAVLIYYNSVSGGIPNNKAKYAYHSGAKNYEGPVTAIVQLPTTTQWKNIRLSNATRAIKNELGGNTTTGGTLPDSYSYEGYAARLLTYQELVSGCGNQTLCTSGGLDTCTYIIENTMFSSSGYAEGYWLETPYANGYRDVTNIYGKLQYTCYGGASGTGSAGIRPVIEVPISDIEY